VLVALLAAASARAETPAPGVPAEPAAAAPDAPAPGPPAPPVAAAPAELGLDPATIVGAPEGSPLAGEALHAATRETALKLRCPTCQGMSVAESPAEGARAMKHEVEKMRAAGFSEAQVLDFFEASYGPFILLAPRQEGANLALWIAPPALLLVGGLLALGQLRRRPASPPPAPPPPERADPWRDRVRREIEE
jgi:cytochrome c-type biogenesis protein CcmH